MDSVKKKNLEENYQRIVNLGFCLVPYEDLSDLIGPNPMVFGTTKDEKILSYEGIDALFKSQFEQMGSMEPTLERNRIATRISADENNAFIIEELTLSIPSSEEVKTLFIRVSCVMEYIDNQWKLTHWHSSTPVNTENDPWHMEEWKREKEKLWKLVDKQTAELVKKNRELEIEAALERIRAQAMAMQESSDLLDIVVIMRTEFVKLGYEAHYFWHMRWLPEHYKKAMTSGDGSRIGMVMTLPRHIHGDIKPVEKWEKSGEPTYVLAMDVDTAVDYVDKMITLGDFEQVDPQAPTLDDIRHIGGLTFIMARTTHGEIGFSLPGVEPNPPKDAVDTLVRFAGVFDLAYKRFEDLKVAERQHREAQIELALERVRARTMAMQKSEELADAAFVLFEQLRELGGNLWGTGFGLCSEDKDDDVFWFANENGVFPPVSIPNTLDPAHKKMYEGWKSGKEFLDIEGSDKDLRNHYEYMMSLPEVKPFFQKILDEGLSLPEWQQWNAAYFSHGYLLVITLEPYPDPEILKRFARVFDQTYTRFLDLKIAEAQARESEMQLALERVRSRTMAMQHSNELAEVSSLLFQQMKKLGVSTYSSGFTIWDEDQEELISWMCNADGTMNPTFRMPIEENNWHHDMYKSWKNEKDFVVKDFTGEDMKSYFRYLRSFPLLDKAFATSETAGHPVPERQVHHVAHFSHGNLLFITLEPVPEAHDIFKRFAKVFQQTYTRFLDLQKAEEQAREAKIEAALEKVRSRTMAMHDSEELSDVAALLFNELRHLGAKLWTAGFAICKKDDVLVEKWMGSPISGQMFEPLSLPYTADHGEQKMYDTWKNGIDLYSYVQDGKELSDIYEHLMTISTFRANFQRVIDAGIPLPVWQKNYVASYKYGYLLIITTEEFEDEHIFPRFAKVFEQTYTRFLDLKKAEEQAREAQIEAALERVRSRTMAMQHSDELIETSELMFEQIKNLDIELWSCGFSLWYDNDSYFMGYNTGPDGKMGDPLKIPLTEDVFFTTIREAKGRGEDFLVFESEGESLAQTYSYMDKLPVVGEFMRSIVMAGAELPKYQVTHCGFFSHGHLMFITEQSIQEAHDIFKRFTRVFDQTYTRFLDLQKAESQAQEAKIETALEKIRSRTMGMQKGNELQEVAVLLYKELIALGVTNFVTCGYVEVNEEIQTQHTWVTSPGGDTMGLFHLPLTGDDTFDARYAAWKNQETVFHQSVAGKVRSDHLEYAITTFNSKEAEDMVRSQFPDPTVFYCFNFPHGYLHTVGGSLLEKEEELLLARFTKVFAQTYTRFLDLQKAEAQAREAQIETSLEKVRSRTMGMQSSDELPEVANMLFLEVQELGIPAWSCGYCILEEDRRSSTCIMSSEGALQKPFLLPHTGEASFEEWDAFVHSDETFFTQELGGKAIESHHDFMKSLPQLEPILKDLDEAGLTLPTYQINHLCKFPHGFLLFITYEEVPGSHDIFKRFTSVFDQTYTRFLDLKKSEQRAREAEVELSLERVRSQVTAMQASSDLFDIVVNLRKEFISLGHTADYFWHMSWLADSYEMSMTSEDGNRIGMVISLPKFVHEEIPGLIEWEKGTDPVYVLALNADDAWAYIDEMNTHGHYEQADPNAPTQEDIQHIGGLTFIIARTTHGEIGFSLSGEVPNPPQESLDTLVRFAGVFDLAYQRFEDLQEAEHQAKLIREERDRLEAALKELHATQDQLIQQEKLASLGQLTAGIAHEIKNPLNFVNNFSEVSVELIEEALEELAKFPSDSEEVDEILSDIESNLRKIYEHGSRADSIVKSMLEHSRGGSGKMEPTELNALVKEFVTLSYHGMRASKHPIDVELMFELNDKAGNANLITEDFSRVIVNLCNNSFDAMRSKLQSNDEILNSHGYMPILTIRTLKENGKISVAIEDNGPGISEDIKDKILQPFFTTKKGTDGTGLGLSITNDIIKAHGGTLDIESDPDIGSKFIITL